MLPKKRKHVETRLPKAVLEHLGDVSSLEGKVQRAQEAGLAWRIMHDFPNKLQYALICWHILSTDVACDATGVL